MTKSITPGARRIIFRSLIGIFVLLLGNFVVLPQTFEHRSASRVEKVFSTQKSLLLAPLEDLGIAGTPKEHRQCIEVEYTFINTAKQCETFINFPYNGNQLSDKVIADYPAKAAKIDKVLSDNGWSADHQEAGAPKTLVDIDPHAGAHAGLGAGIAFHKNLGNISCNLKIDYYGIQNSFMIDTLNVNTFICREDVIHFMLHFDQQAIHGP